MSKQFVTVNEIKAIVECISADTELLDGTTRTTIDFVGKLRGHIKALGTFDKAFTTFVSDIDLPTVTPQGHSGTVKGISWFATVVEAVRWTLDAKVIRAEMGDEWADARCKMATVRTTKYNEIFPHVMQGPKI